MFSFCTFVTVASAAKSTGNRYAARHISPLSTLSWNGDNKRYGTTYRSAFNFFGDILTLQGQSYGGSTLVVP